MKKDKIIFYLGFSKNGCDDDLLVWINLLEKKGYKKTVYISKALYYYIHQLDISIGNINIKESNTPKYIPQICVTIKDCELIDYLIQKEKEGIKYQQVVKDAIRYALNYSKDISTVPSILDLEYSQKQIGKDSAHNKNDLIALLNTLDKNELYHLLSNMLNTPINESLPNPSDKATEILEDKVNSKIIQTEKSLVFEEKEKPIKNPLLSESLNDQKEIHKEISETPTIEQKSEEMPLKETNKNPFGKKVKETLSETPITEKPKPKPVHNINPFVMAAIE